MGSRLMDSSTNEIKVKFIPATKWYRRAKWQLLQPYISHNGNVNVSAGFISDGATVPLIVSWMFSPTGKYFGAAIVHDFLITVKKDWDKANIEFNEEMRALNVSNFRRRIIMGAVRIYYKLRYKL